MEETLIRWQIEFKKGYAKPCILLVLSKGTYHAYRITTMVNELTKGQINIAGSNIYPQLRGLMKEKLIEQYTTEGQKMYRITDLGDKFLNQLSESLFEFLLIIHDILKSRSK